MSAVGAVYDRTFFVDSTKYGRSQTAPTVRQLQLFEIESHFELHPYADGAVKSTSQQMPGAFLSRTAITGGFRPRNHPGAAVKRCRATPPNLGGEFHSDA